MMARMKQEVVVAGHHVLGTEIHERKDIRPIGRSDKSCVFSANAVGEYAIKFSSDHAQAEHRCGQKNRVNSGQAKASKTEQRDRSFARLPSL